METHEMKLAALNLPIAKKWFDMIASGKKREEYRDGKNRQVLRLCNWMTHSDDWPSTMPTAIFRNGYRMDSPALVVEIKGMTIRGGNEVKHPKWGEQKSRGFHFVIKLGLVISLGTYAEIAAKIIKAKGLK